MIYDRLRLPEGSAVAGPALLVQADATIYVELSTITYDNEALFSDLELDGITTIVPSTNPNFSKFIDICYEHGAIFFNEKYQEIIRDEWKKQVVDSIACTISIAECEPEG